MSVIRSIFRWGVVVCTAFIVLASGIQAQLYVDDFPLDARLRELSNVALNKPTKTSHARGDYTGDKAVDGNWIDLESRWLASGGAPFWLEIDLEGQHRLEGASIWTGHHPGGNPLYIVPEFALQYQADGEWVDIPGGRVTGNGDEYVELLFPESIVADYVRFITETGDWNYDIVRVRELEIFGTALDD